MTTVKTQHFFNVFSFLLYVYCTYTSCGPAERLFLRRKDLYCLFFCKTEKKTTFKTHRLLDCLLYYKILCLGLIQYNKDCQLALHYVKEFSVNDRFRSVWQLCTVLYSYSQLLYKFFIYVLFFKKKLIICSFFPVFQIRIWIGSGSRKAKNNPPKKKKVKCFK